MNHAREIPTDKPGLREWAKAKRATLDIGELTPKLLARLQAEPEWKTARHVLLYLAMPDEVNVESLIQAEPGRNWYVPRCAPKRRLAVHPYTPGQTPLVSGPFGIREPDPSRVGEVAPHTLDLLDLVIVPALALGENGERLGYGGGYYDRFLPALSPRCVRGGVLPDALVLPVLPRDGWDVPLHMVVTETRRLGSL